MGKSKKRPQVFINFRGKDERHKLSPHLKHHLERRNVKVFTDEEATGELVENLFKHIRISQIVIVIFSINYLESRWCLDELVEVQKYLETEKLAFVIPIFYKVEPSHVKKQSGKFGARFTSLKENYRKSRIKKWKKALRFVAKSIGLTYEKRSSISEFDFIMKIVDRVDIALNKIASMDDGNNFPETSRGESSTQKSTIVEAPNLERSYVQGFIHGSAWKDVTISSMQRSYSFRISPLTNPLQLPINLQSIDAQRTDFLEKAINWLALHMMSEQTHPALLFSNWEELDYYTKNYIIDSARRKCQMLKGYNGGVDPRPFLSPNIPPFVEVLPAWNRMLEPNVPQDWLHRDNRHRHSISYPLVHRQSRGHVSNCSSNFSTPMLILEESSDDEKENRSCISYLCYYFKRCFSFKRGAIEDNEE